MAFAEQLLTWKLGESNERSEDELDTVPSSVLLQVVELLGRLNTLLYTLVEFKGSKTLLHNHPTSTKVDFTC